MARFDLTDFEWTAIEPVLPTNTRGVAGRRPACPERHLLAAAERERPGATLRIVMALTRHVRTGSDAGAKRAFGIAFSRPCQRLTTAASR